MRRFRVLPNIKTVLNDKFLFGLFFIFWYVLVNVLFVDTLNFGLSNIAQANVVTFNGLDQGDQSDKEQWFHQGMQAYLDSDYQKAYSVWNKAAADVHSKAAFNVGRMWLLGQVPGQLKNKQQAEIFFKQSADLGYSPATQYLHLSKNNP